jgi:hypothetical protein
LEKSRILIESVSKGCSVPCRPPVSSDKRFRESVSIGGSGTPERWRHSGHELVQTDRLGVLVARATEEHILDVPGLKKLFSEIQVQGELRL